MLGDGTVVLMLDRRPYCAFYARGTDDLLFVVGVERSSYASGGWGPVVRRLPVESLPAVPPMVRQSAAGGACSIVQPGRTTRLAVPRAECVGLEREAVWSASYIVSRLEDHYAGRPNAFAESLRVLP